MTKHKNSVDENTVASMEKRLRLLEDELIKSFERFEIFDKRMQFMEDHVRSSYFGPDTATTVNPEITAILANMDEDQVESDFLGY